MLSITLICTELQLNAQDINLDWVRQVGGSCWNFDEDDVTHAVAIDGLGNVYSAGYFCGTMDFDPGIETLYITSSSSYNPDLFIYKLNATGNLLWVKTVASNVGSWTKLAIAADSIGHVYTTGTFMGEVDFDPGADSFKLGSETMPAPSAFVLKLNNDGDFEWVKNFESQTYGDIAGQGVALDTAGNIFAIGKFAAMHTDFNPGVGSADTFLISSQGAYDIYIAKLNASGDFMWAKSFGAAGNDQPTSIAVDIGGNIHTIGDFSGTVDFDPGIGISNLTATGYVDAFISKLDNDGNFIWVKSFLADATLNPYNRVYGTGIDVDASGNVYTKGAFGGTVDFDPGPLSNILVTPGPNDMYIFVTKLDSLGNFVWVKTIQGGWEAGAIVIDTFSNIYMTGVFAGTSDFDPGAGVFNLTAGQNDVYISKLTANGDFVWAKGLGGYSYDKGYDIAVDPAGKSVYTVGSFAAINGGQADFDPGEDTLIFTAAGNSDGFIHKMSCNTYGVLTVTECDSFTFNGTTYTASGTYITQTLSNAVGCDSIITIDLTLTHSTSSTTTETACDSFSINGQTYTSSGTYTLQTLTNAAGCDSLLLLELTINDANAAVTQTDNTLTANTTGAIYQWVDCNNGNSAIAGAVQQTFIATTDGSYAVVVTKNGCSDTSTCYTITGLGIDEKGTNNFVSVYPNPVNGILTITTSKMLRYAHMKLINIIGQSMSAQTNVSGNHFDLDMASYAAGTYILEIEADGVVSRTKIVKK